MTETMTFSCSIFKLNYVLQRRILQKENILPFCFAAKKQVLTRMSEGVNNSRAGPIGLIQIYFLKHCVDEGQDFSKML